MVTMKTANDVDSPVERRASGPGCRLKRRVTMCIPGPHSPRGSCCGMGGVVEERQCKTTAFVRSRAGLRPREPAN